MKSLSVFLMCLTVAGTILSVQAFAAETDCKNIVQAPDAKSVKGGTTAVVTTPAVKTKRIVE